MFQIIYYYKTKTHTGFWHFINRFIIFFNRIFYAVWCCARVFFSLDELRHQVVTNLLLCCTFFFCWRACLCERENFHSFCFESSFFWTKTNRITKLYEYVWRYTSDTIKLRVFVCSYQIQIKTIELDFPIQNQTIPVKIKILSFFVNLFFDHFKKIPIFHASIRLSF